MTQPVDLNGLLGPTPEPAKPAGSSGVFDQEMFLKLLVAQLRYQNPLKPMDSSEFMSQASQLATVETLQAISTSQAQTLSWQRSLAASSLVGRQVEGILPSGESASGLVQRVSLTASAASVVLESGQVIPLESITSVGPASVGNPEPDQP